MQTIAPSIGQQFRAFSSSSTLRNRGVEASLGLQPIRTRDASWLFRTTFALNRSKITHLSVPTFQTGGFGTSLGTFQIEQGKSATQMSERGPGRRGRRRVPQVPDVIYQRHRLQALSLGFLFDWKQGGDIINLTEFLYDAGQNSKDFETRWTAAPDRFCFEDRGVRAGRLVPETARGDLGIHTANYITSSLFGSKHAYARLSLSGRNLLRFTGYRGLDPEVSNFGNQAIVRNVDVAPFPPSRSFFLSIDLGF